MVITLSWANTGIAGGGTWAIGDGMVIFRYTHTSPNLNGG